MGAILIRMVLALLGLSWIFRGSDISKNESIRRTPSTSAEKNIATATTLRNSIQPQSQNDKVSLRAQEHIQTTIEGASQIIVDTATPKIPHRIIVVDTRYTGLDEMPALYLSNVKNTIEIYKNHWGGDMDLVFMGYDACQKAIEQVEIRLIKYYWKEQDGTYKSDLCRYAALFLHGGYYFDNDMMAVRPVTVAPHTTFVSPHELRTGGDGAKKGAGLFNSFIAVAPRHPIIKKTLYYALQYYEKGMTFGTHMGTGALFHAYNSIDDQDVRATTDTEMSEIRLSELNYPDVPRLDGLGCCCDIVVHSDRNREIYFYSHFVGPPGKYTCGAKPA
jgi:hypothetical protein